MASEPETGLDVAICLGWADKQLRLPIKVAPGSSIAAALAQAEAQLNAFDPQWRDYSIAVFGKRAATDTPVQQGDQIELLRDLLLDPKLARQRRVELKRRAQGRSAWRRNSRSQQVQNH